MMDWPDAAQKVLELELQELESELAELLRREQEIKRQVAVSWQLVRAYRLVIADRPLRRSLHAPDISGCPRPADPSPPGA